MTYQIKIDIWLTVGSSWRDFSENNSTLLVIQEEIRNPFVVFTISSQYKYTVYCDV